MGNHWGVLGRRMAWKFTFLKRALWLCSGGARGDQETDWRSKKTYSMSRGRVTVAWVMVAVMDQKWIFWNTLRWTGTQNVLMGFMWGWRAGWKNGRRDSDSFGLAIVGQCCHLLRWVRKECGRKHYFCFRDDDFGMLLNRYWSRDVTVGR